MSNLVHRILGALGAVAIVISFALWTANSQYRLDASIANVQAQDSLVQGTDLMQIASFRYVNPTTLEVTDDLGRPFKMELVAACPGLKDASDFSLVTDGYRSLDKFTGVLIHGQLCRFKDFSPLQQTAKR